MDRLITPSAPHLASSGIGSARLHLGCSPCLADFWTALAEAAGRMSLCGSPPSPSSSARCISCHFRMVEGCTGRVGSPGWRYVTVRSGGRPIRHRAEGGRNCGCRYRARGATRDVSTTSCQPGGLISTPCPPRRRAPISRYKSPLSSSSSRRCARSCSPVPRRPASAICA